MLIHKSVLICVIAMMTAAFFSCEKHEGARPDTGGHGDQHGTPKDWKFTLVQGDAAEGRKLFVEIECYKCHEVKGESFPRMAPDEKGVGPELSQMAGMHPIEFFAEAIANPNAVIDNDAKEQGYVGPDGKSKMPEFADILTVKQLADLATYLASLGGGHKP
jgi:mono/diheme cytochrome c family protein